MPLRSPPKRGSSPDPAPPFPEAAGFTLIEVITALLVISVMAAMIFQTTGGGLWRTARGVNHTRTLFELQERMEEIVRIYKQNLADGDGNVDIAGFRDTVMGLGLVDAGRTDYLSESGTDFSLGATPTPLLLVTLTNDGQSLCTIFSR